MSFLFPLYLLGAAAVTVPIVLHLTRRRVRRRVRFSSLMFLEPTPLTVKRRNRPEHLLLLLLRCAVLLLLALMFARPFLPQQLSAAPAEPGVRTVVLLDTSASMRRAGLWDAALAEAREVVEQSEGEADRLAVLAFDRGTRGVMRFEEWADLGVGRRGSVASSRIEGLTPGWGGTNLGGALVAGAEAALEAQSGRERAAAEQRVVLISDMQAGAELAALRGYEWPEGVRLVVRSVEAEGGSNAGLQRMLAGGRLAGDEEPTLRVRITNAEGSEKQRFRLRWEDDGSGEGSEVHVPAGSSRVVEAPARGGASGGATGGASGGGDSQGGSTDGGEGESGPGVGTLVLSGDDHDFDNHLHIAPQPPRPIRIVYLGGTDASDAGEPLYYLRRAFQQTRRRKPEVAAHPPGDAADAASIEDADLVVIGRPLPEGAIEPVRRHLENGGTALLTMREPGAAETLAGLAGAEGVTATEAEVDDYVMLEELAFSHPLLAAFDEPRFSDFTKIHFWQYRRLDLAGLGEEARVLARFDSGDPAWVEVPVGPGSLLVMTSSWAPADGQLALSTKFVPLLYAVLERSVGSGGLRGRFHVGDPIELPEGRSEADRVQSVRLPGGERLGMAADQRVFEGTTEPGHYALESGGGGLRRVAVNLDPAESRTAAMPVERLKQFGARLSPPEVSAASAAEAGAEAVRQARDAELERRQRLWRWALVAALALLMAETWLAGRLSRSAAE